MGLERLQVAGTHSAIYEAYYHQVDPNGAGTIQALDAARFLKKSRLSDVVLSKIWDLSDPTGKGYLDKAGLFVALKLVALAQAGKDINMSNIHSEAPPPKVGELPKVPPMSAAPPGRPAAPSPAPLMPLSDWSMKPAERDKYSQLFDTLQPNNGLIAGNKVKGMLMESKLPIETLGKIWDLADQDKDGMLDRHEFMVAMHLVYKALEKHAVPTTLPPELRGAGGAGSRPARPASRPPSRPPSRPASRPPSRPASPQARPPPRPLPPQAPHPPLQPQSNAALLEGLLDLSSPPTQTAPTMPPSIPPVPASLNSSMMNSISSGTTTWVVTDAEKALFDTQFAAADTDHDGFVSGNEIKHMFLDSGLPQQTLAHIWALCDTGGAGKLSCGQFALAMWLVQRALRGLPPPPALTPDMLPPPAAAKSEAIQSLGPQPTPEMEAIAREVDALARERLALEAELAAKQRDLTVKTGEADSLQSELDTLTATLKQLENQKGEAQKRLNDLKAQVEKLRSQVSAQEAAAAETEAEVAARRAAAHTLKEKERALQADVAEADAEAEALTAQLRRTVLAVSQANIKISYLEEQHRVISSAAEALAAPGPAGAGVLQLAPQFSAEHLERVVRGATPSDALEDEPFAKSNGFASRGFDADPFAERGADPFAPSAAQDGFGTTDPFASNADPFAGDAFAAQDNTAKPNEDPAWAADPFAVLHAPALPPKQHKTPPPRPAPPRPAQHKTDKQAAMDFADDPFKDYRYEDPFNIEDPFADVPDNRRADPFARPTSVAGFETDDFFSASSAVNGSFAPSDKRSGRVSAPPVAYDPFAGRASPGPAAPAWPAWPAPDWAADDAWAGSARAWPGAPADGGSPAAQPAPDNWAADWGAADCNRNLNDTWPSSTLPAKKDKSPRRVMYARSLVHTIGGIGRARQKDKKAKGAALEAKSASALPSEEQQWAWAAAESRRLQAEAEARRQREEAELRLALALSRQDK